MARPPVDVVVPFRGSPAELRNLQARLSRLSTRPGDSLVVVDNAPRGEPAPHGVLRAPDLQTPGYARNRGVAAGSADWVVFFDADCVPATDLLDRYFEPPPGPRTALLAGGVRDEEVPAGAPAAARYAYIRGLMAQDNTFSWGRWSWAQTANAAVRREAFEEVGGFREEIRAGEDADLTYRLKEAGWEVERREEASVVHIGRQTVRALVRQKAQHGAGAAWLDEHYPGSIPRRRRPGLVWWALRTAAKGLLSAGRTRDRDRALWALLEPVELLAVEFGRSLPNEVERQS